MRLASVAEVRKLLNRERLYVWMLSFILLVNAGLIFAGGMTQLKKASAAKQGSLAGDAGSAKLDQDDDTWSQDQQLMNELLSKKGPATKYLYVLAAVATYFFVLGLFLDIRLVMARIRRRWIFTQAPEHEPVRWELPDVFRLVIIFISVAYILNIVDAQLAPYLFSDKEIQRYSPLIKTGVMDLLFLAVLVYFVKIKYRQGLSALGLKMKSCAKNIYTALLGYIAFLPVLFFLLLALVWFAQASDYNSPHQVLYKLFFREKRTWLIITGAVLAVLVGPVVEEVFFRGFAYNALKRRWGAPLAAVLTATVFAGLHANLLGFVPIMALGLLLAYAYEITGSLVSSITIHIVHNSLMIGMLFFGRYLTQLAQ